MKEHLKKDLPMIIGFIVAMCIIDVISGGTLEIWKVIIRIIATMVVYFLCRISGSKKKK